MTFPAIPRISVSRYVEELHKQGHSDIVACQVATNGNCRITFSNRVSAEAMVAIGFNIENHKIEPSFASKPRIQLHVHDCPIWISDSVVLSVLAQYGNVVGPIRHGKIKVAEDMWVATGVRFATFEMKRGCTSLPSYLRTTEGTYTFRIFHANQIQTCRLCSSTSHIARDCPQKATQPTRPVPGAESAPCSSSQSTVQDPAGANLNKPPAPAPKTPNTKHEDQPSLHVTTDGSPVPGAESAPCSSSQPTVQDPAGANMNPPPKTPNTNHEDQLSLHVTTDGSDTSDAENSASDDSDNDDELVTAQNSVAASDDETATSKDSTPQTTSPHAAPLNSTSDSGRTDHLLNESLQATLHDTLLSEAKKHQVSSRKRPASSILSSTETSPEHATNQPKANRRGKRAKKKSRHR